MKTLYRIYYRIKLGKDYQKRLDDAKKLWGYIELQNPGNGPTRTYNANGEQIRGWHTPPYKFDNVHPLIAKYS